MARFNQASWQPLAVNFARGRPQAVNLVIIHITLGSMAGTDSWLRNPQAQVSYHFGVARNGNIRQWVDTSNTAWHAMAANGRSIGIGNEGTRGQSLTPEQITANAAIIRWANGVHSAMRVQQASGASAGVGWHRMYVATECPGDAIIRQVPTVVNRAQGASVSQTGPFRQVADGTYSLDQLVRRRNTTINNIINTSFGALNRANSAAFARYLAGPGRGARMPRGLVYWTRNP